MGKYATTLMWSQLTFGNEKAAEKTKTQVGRGRTSTYGRKRARADPRETAEGLRHT